MSDFEQQRLVSSLMKLKSELEDARQCILILQREKSDKHVEGFILEEMARLKNRVAELERARNMGIVIEDRGKTLEL